MLKKVFEISMIDVIAKQVKKYNFAFLPFADITYTKSV